jgi:TM2 domain-containing membrane protein YozV
MNQPAPWRPGQPPQRINPRSPIGAIVLSLIIPGLGSMYGGEVGIGVVILCAYLVSFALILAIIGLVLCPAVWIFGLWHAYHAVTRWNRERGIIS